MTKPLIHPASDVTLSLLMKDLPQSLLLTGPVGVGLSTIARYIADSMAALTLTVLPEKDEKVDIEKGTITVESIRKLYDQTRTIQKGKRVIIIDYAERMAVTAQNAFLKLLEEPGEGTYFILATHAVSRLLPTIRSRVQEIDMRPLTSAQTQTYIDELGIDDANKKSQLLFIASGLPAELSRLTTNPVYFEEKVTLMRDARELLQGSTYSKLLIAQKYRDNRVGSLDLITSATNILRRSISAKPQVSLISQIDDLLYAYDRIKANGNIRLCLARLVI